MKTKNIIPVAICLFGLSCANCSGSQPSGQDDSKTSGQAGSQPSDQTGSPVVVLNRIAEPNESAFSVLVPKGWQIAGGIYRIDPTQQGGAAQSIAAKYDFAVKKDAAGTVMYRWLPDVLFFDPKYSPAAQFGFMTPGSNYNGMTVYPVMPATLFIREIAFPYAHPEAQNVKVIEVLNLEKIAREYKKFAAATVPFIDFSYDAALVTFSYTEHGVTYTEKMFCLIEDYGRAGAGLWGNKQTMYARTPVNEFDKYEPLLSVIQQSVAISPQWLAAELRGQQARGEIMFRTQQEAQRIGEQITVHQQKTNAEIHNDMFLTLTGQEEYVNPFTNEVETGSNHWKYRWVNAGGEVIYTDNESYDPRVDINLNRSDYKRTPVRERFPGSN